MHYCAYSADLKGGERMSIIKKMVCFSSYSDAFEVNHERKTSCTQYILWALITFSTDVHFWFKYQLFSCDFQVLLLTLNSEIQCASTKHYESDYPLRLCAGILESKPTICWSLLCKLVSNTVWSSKCPIWWKFIIINKNFSEGTLQKV